MKTHFYVVHPFGARFRLCLERRLWPAFLPTSPLEVNYTLAAECVAI